MTTEGDIQELLDRETAAWDARDGEQLVSLFNSDMVWPWPPDSRAHAPASWVFPQGRFDRERWKAKRRFARESARASRRSLAAYRAAPRSLGIE